VGRTYLTYPTYPTYLTVYCCAVAFG